MQENQTIFPAIFDSPKFKRGGSCPLPMPRRQWMCRLYSDTQLTLLGYFFSTFSCSHVINPGLFAILAKNILVAIAILGEKSIAILIAILFAILHYLFARPKLNFDFCRCAKLFF